MKAREENGSIKIYHEMPISWKGVSYYAGDFHLKNDAVHLAEGFYPVVVPTYDPEVEKLGDIYFDEDKFTYPIESLNLDIDEVKEAKLLDLRRLMAGVQSAANPYLQRLQYAGEEPPQEFKTKTSQLYSLFDFHKNAISNMTDWEKVAKYQLPYEIAEAAKKDLEKLL